MRTKAATTGWNPYYIQYARAHGVSDPATMLVRDRDCYPGGVMAGFSTWIQGKWVEWRQENDHTSSCECRFGRPGEFLTWLKKEER